MDVRTVSMPEMVDLKLQFLDRLIRLRDVVGDTDCGRATQEYALGMIHNIERELLLDNAAVEDKVNVGNLTVNITAETTPELDELLKKIGEHTSITGNIIAEACKSIKVNVEG
ncbi:hypothetical protein D3C77_317350 [compost metagenome]